MVWLASTEFVRLSFLLLWAAPKLTMAQTELYMTNMAYHVLGNLDQFDYLYVYYYACAWTPDYNAHGEEHHRRDRKLMDENDRWYQDSSIWSGANVAYALYGYNQTTMNSLKRRQADSHENAPCGKNHYLGSFYTMSGIAPFTAALYKGTGNSNVNPTLGTCYADENGEMMGLACDGSSGTFVLMNFTDTPDDVCRMSYASGVIDPLTTFNSALHGSGCVKIYDSSEDFNNNAQQQNNQNGDQHQENNNGYANNVATNLLQYSLPCSDKDPIGECPNPNGALVLQEQQRYREYYNIPNPKSNLDEVQRQQKSGVAMGSIGLICLFATIAIISMEIYHLRRRRMKPSLASAAAAVAAAEADADGASTAVVAKKPKKKSRASVPDNALSYSNDDASTVVSDSSRGSRRKSSAMQKIMQSSKILRKVRRGSGSSQRNSDTGIRGESPTTYYRRAEGYDGPARGESSDQGSVRSIQ